MKMSRLRIAAVAAMSAAAIALAGCSGGGGSPSSPSASAPSGETPVAGGDLEIIVAGTIATWDPGSSTGSFPGVNWDRLGGEPDHRGRRRDVDPEAQAGPHLHRR